MWPNPIPSLYSYDKKAGIVEMGLGDNELAGVSQLHTQAQF